MRSDQRVPGLISVFQCEMDFPKDVYTIFCSNILATHSLESFTFALLISKYFPEHGSMLVSVVGFLRNGVL
mgnify:CR=1